MSLRKKSIQGVLWVFIQQFSNQAVTFVISIFLARILLPEDFGLIGMITVFMALSQVLLNAGLTQSLIRQPKPQQIDYSTVFYFNISVSVILYLVIFLCAGLIADFYTQPILRNIIRFYSLTIVINAFGAVQFTKLTKEMNFKTQMTVTVPSLIISGIVGVILAYMDFGVWSLVYMAILQSLLSTIQVWFRSGWIPSFEFSKRRFRYHFSFSYKLGLSGILNSVYSNIYQIIIGKFFAPALVGFYTRAVTMKNLPVTNIANSLNKVTYPMFAEIQNDNVRLKKVYKMILQSVIFILAPIMIYLMVVAEPLFRFLFTEKWLPAVPYFQILCVSGIIFPIHSYNLNILKVKGRSDLFLKLEIAKKVLGVIVIIISIQYGIIALLWGQLISSILALFINSYYSGRFIEYKIWSQLKDISPIFIISGLVGIIGWYLDSNVFSNLNDLLRIFLPAFIGLVLFVGISFTLKLEALNNLVSLIKKRK
ncbi:lipopolysaccharide biosynthesis protein [Brumimicrobium mesophilum]|uniref:lipopolysaccharide biosynthesis protein n=1 Tax=Brumimicrobium mesophilum TaxID=392717 RepID=UPI000D140567|nr:lipopolysaccharide biosynthesis protein [Brumimicrobium mesophilum]